MNSPLKTIAEFENTLQTHAPAYGIELSDEALRQLSAYYQLINTWNPRLHLVAPCSPSQFAQRHILESLLLLRHFPDGARIVDIGSGAGLPIIPCLISRADLSAVLIESAKRKAVFLREALALVSRATATQVIAERFENVSSQEAQFITSRALDRFAVMMPVLIEWAPKPITLLLFGGNELRNVLNSLGPNHSEILIPKSERRFLFKVELKQ